MTVTAKSSGNIVITVMTEDCGLEANAMLLSGILAHIMIVKSRSLPVLSKWEVLKQKLRLPDENDYQQDLIIYLRSSRKRGFTFLTVRKIQIHAALMSVV